VFDYIPLVELKVIT